MRVLTNVTMKSINRKEQSIKLCVASIAARCLPAPISTAAFTRMCRLSCILAVLLVTVASPQHLSAQPAALGALGDLVGRDLISKAKAAAQQLLDDFDVKANLLSARLADQLTVGAETTVLLAGSELDKQVKQMSQPVQMLMVNLNQLIDTVNGLRADSYHLADAVAVDIKSLTANVPLFGEKFYIQRVDGILQLKKDSAYRLNVLAVGVGPASQRRRSTVGITVKGRPLTDVAVDQIQANTASILIPQADLNPLFDNIKPVRVDATLEFDIEQKGIAGWRRPQHYSIPFRLTLMPTNAGKIQVVARVHDYDWTDTGQRDQKFLTTTNLDGAGRSVRWMLDLRVPGTGSTPPKVGDQKYRTEDIKFECVSQIPACGFRNIFYVQPMDSDRTIEAYWDTNSLPTTWRLSAEIMQWAQKADKDEEPFELPIEFGKNVLIQVPNDWELVHITGKTVTGEPIDVVYPSGSDLLKPLPVQPGSNTIIYYVQPPDLFSL